MENILKAGFCVLVFGLVNSDRKFPASGPKPGEIGKYVYKDTWGDFKHCLYCPSDAFESTEKNEEMQEPACIDHYDNIKEEITPYELETKKIPVCKIGETPGCGPPPEEKKTADYVWYCDPGYSNVQYSVYFSCLLINKLTKVVAWSYYCNESLVWVMGSSMQVDLDATGSPTHKGDFFKVLLIVIAAVGTLLVALVVAACICVHKKRQQHARSTHADPEASVTLMSEQPIKSTMTPTDGSVSGSDITVATSTEDEKQHLNKSNERLLPYGEEKHSDTKGCQTDTLNIRNIESLQNFTGGHCTRAQNVYSHNTAANTTVRAELQTSVMSNSKTYQCPVHRYQNPSPEINSTPQSVLEMKSARYQEFPSDMNNLDKGAAVTESEDSSRERPNPLGNSTAHVCTESGYFDDENDKRHNTELKRKVNESLTEYPECNSCEQLRHEHSQPHTSQCICTSQTLSLETENEILSASNYRVVVDEDQSFEIQLHQLLPH